MKEAEIKVECRALTTNSELKNSLVEKIVDLLEGLQSYGFSQPIVKREHWSTTITLSLTHIALEIEIDWRDIDIFVLVVRLKNGNLPNGYYVSDGRPCRYHLQRVIGDRKWHIDQDALAAISPRGEGRGRRGDRSEDTLIDRFYAYRRVMDSCIDRLVAEEDVIFKD